MYYAVHAAGVDPGLVHTGVVGVEFDPLRKKVRVDHEVILGPDVDAVKQAIEAKHPRDTPVFIEGYRPRSAFDTDAKMVVAVSEMKKATGGMVIANTGVKKVIRRRLMQELGMWKFATASNHQDLRSAAYILLYGMVKDPQLNEVLAEFVRDHLAGEPWSVVQ